MKIENKKSYVYMYRLDDVPVYVGIGTEDGGQFQRALHLEGHESISSEEYENLQIDIVHRNMSRVEARTMETALIQVLGKDHELRNKRRSNQDVKVRTVYAAGAVDEQSIVDTQLATIKDELVKECLGFLEASGPALNNIFLEPEVDESAHILSLIAPDYDPELDSLISKFHDWWYASGFKPQCDKVVIVVPKEQQAEKLREVTKDILFVTGSPAVMVASLETWVRAVLSRRKELKRKEPK